jgi:hypothetical protein
MGVHPVGFDLDPARTKARRQRRQPDAYAGQGRSVALSADGNTALVGVCRATAAPGSLFAGWSGSGCSGTGTCTVTMSSAPTRVRLRQSVCASGVQTEFVGDVPSSELPARRSSLLQATVQPPRAQGLARPVASAGLRRCQFRVAPVPKLATPLAAFAGGFVGAWLQRRGAARKAEPIPSDAPGPQQDPAIPAGETHFLSEQREQAYATFGESLYELIDVFERAGATGPSREAVGRANAAIRKALMLVKIVGSEEQTALAERVAAVAGSRYLQQEDVQALRDLRSEFFARARRELQSSDLDPASSFGHNP